LLRRDEEYATNDRSTFVKMGVKIGMEMGMNVKLLTKRSLAGLAWIGCVSILPAAFALRAAPEQTNAALQTPAATTRKESVLSLDPGQSKLHFTLGTTLHTVHGTFALKRGTLRFAPDGKASGEIVADAVSGESGDSGRDKKMHKDVLESARFGEVIFHPDHVAGAIPAKGPVTAELHGTLELHGSIHELTVPVQAEISGDHWTGTGTFKVPYVDWGLKSPSNFFLKADPVVDVELELAGTVSRN
jgi:polyisoprenoid-binding protein YceI